MEKQLEIEKRNIHFRSNRCRQYIFRHMILILACACLRLAYTSAKNLFRFYFPGKYKISAVRVCNVRYNDSTSPLTIQYYLDYPRLNSLLVNGMYPSDDRYCRTKCIKHNRLVYSHITVKYRPTSL